MEMRETEKASMPEFEVLVGEIPGSEGKFGMTERAIFWMLHNAAGRIVRHRTMWDTLYSARPDCEYPTTDVLKTHICHIRKKLPGWEIKTHHGIGYSMHKREG